MKHKKLLLSPHNDDETLFAAFTILREHPDVLFITDSYIQKLRGTNITSALRIEESIQASCVLGFKPFFLHIPDTDLDDGRLRFLLRDITADIVYAPAVEGGHRQHDMVGVVAKMLYGDKVRYYSTYAKDRPYPCGEKEVKGTEEEQKLKSAAMDCYQSQKNYKNTQSFFKEMAARCEYLFL